MVLSLLAHSFFYILFLKIIYFFIFGCAGSLLLHAEFLQLQKRGAKFCFNARASHCSVSLLLGTGPACMHFSSCTSRAYSMRAVECYLVAVSHGLSCSVARGVLPAKNWTPFPALAGEFFPTVPPGKSPFFHILFTSLFPFPLPHMQSHI